MRAAREGQLFALLGGVGLDDANAAERFGQTPREGRGYFAALAEQRPQPCEGERQGRAESPQHQSRDQSQTPVEPEQNTESYGRGDHAADQLHQAGADQIAYALGVVHDPRNEFADLGRVEIADRQTGNLCLHFLAHFGDGALRRDSQKLRQAKRGEGLHDGGRARRQRDLPKQISPPLADYLVDQILGRSRKHQPHCLANQHQHGAE